MSNEYFNVSGQPGTGSAGTSAAIRAEFTRLQDAFDKFPAISGNFGKLLVVGLAGIEASSAYAGNAATATALQTPRTINGVSFNGTANITVADGTKAPLTGGGTSGTWPINILGTAGNANQFGGYEQDLNAVTGAGDYLLVRNQAASKISLASAGSAADIVRSGASGTWGISVSGNAATATAFQTTRSINGVGFNGSADITIADATKAPLNGTGASGTWPISISGNSGTATAVPWTGVTGRPTNVSAFTNDAGYLTAAGPSAAGTLTGATLASNVTASSLTSLGTLGSLGVTGTVTAGLFSGPLTGNASSATNVAWAGITSKPTTLAGYGISDAAPLASPAFTGTPVANGIEIGFRRLPAASVTTGSFVSADSGKCVYATGGVTAIANAGMAQGDAVTIYNNTASAVTLTQGASLTLRLAGTATTGNRTLEARGLATIVYISATEAVISGGGLS